GWRWRSRARSALVSTTPPPASVTRQQSSRLNGQQIIRELSTSWIVMGSRYIAFGFSPAHFRVATAISASCSLVVPYWAMCLDAASAYDPAGRGRPYGSSNWPSIVWALEARGGIPTRDRPLSPWVIRATSQRPAAMAAAACATWIRKEQPPTFVPSTTFGSIPRYSPTSAGEMFALNRPSTSLRVRPASRRALRAPSACSCSIDLSGTTPIRSDSSTPTIATLPERELSGIRHQPPGGKPLPPTPSPLRWRGGGL